MFTKAAAVAAGLAMTFSAVAPASAVTIADLQAQIAALMAQLSALSGTSTTVTFTRDLTVGSSGSDVTALQQILVSKGYLTMPVGVAYGYFGSLTKSAVARWQAAVGISPTAGYFGPKSRAALAVSAGTTTGGTTTGGTTTGGTTTGGTTGTTSGTITTPGAEGTIAVTAAPVSTTTYYENERMDAVLAFNVKATGSDVAVQRVKVLLGSDTTQYNKIFQTLYVVDDAGRTLGSLDMNSTNVVKESDGTYSATLSGFSSVVSKGTQRTYTVKADIRSTVDTTYRGVTKTVTLPTNGVRAIDGAGIDLYGPISPLTQSYTVAQSLASSAQLTVSTDSNNPLSQAVVANTGSSNNQADKLPVLVFDVKATNDDVKITDVNNVTITSTGPATASTTYLYVGNGTSGQLLGTAAGVTSTSSFNNISYTIPKGTTATFTVATDIRNATTSGSTVTGSFTANTTNLVGVNSLGDTVTNVSGSAVGNAMTVRSQGLQISLAGTPTISRNSGAFAGATSSALATFNITLKAIGADVIFGTQTASSTFQFATYQGGVKTALNVASTTSWSVPAGVVNLNGVNGQSFKLQQGNTVTIPVSFYFEGRTPAGALITSGAYAVGLESVSWSLTGNDTQSSTFMAGQTAWRTAEVIMP
jgi:hypothetical protein